MKIFIIRHSETNANLERRIQGQLDYPLNERGIFLAKETGKALDYIKFKKAFTSPLDRAYQTCKLILEYSNNKDVKIIKDDRLKEFNFGKFEGTVIDDEYLSKCPKDFKLFFDDTINFLGVEGGESTRNVIERTRDFLFELSTINDDSNYLVVSHGGSIRAMLNMFYPDRENFWHNHVPSNCSVNIVEVKDNTLRLIGDDLIFFDDGTRNNNPLFKKD